jgi:hypothetical protein
MNAAIEDLLQSMGVADYDPLVVLALEEYARSM